MTFKRFVIFLVVISVAFAIFDLYFQFVNIQNEMNEELTNLSAAFSERIEGITQFISIMQLSKNITLPSGIKGIIEINDDGNVVKSYGLENYTRALYDFSALSGTYISPITNVDGNPVITIATKSPSGIIAVEIDPRVALSNANLYIVDQSGFGVNLSSNEWKTFISVLAKNSNFIIDWPYLFVKEPTYGNYTLVNQVRISSIIYSALGASLPSYILILAIFFLTGFLYLHLKKKDKPVEEFLDFLSEIKTFRRYEGSEDQKFVKNYNDLVNEWDRVSKSYASVIDEISQTNTDLIKFNDLYAELPMIFERIDNEESFKDAIRIVARRILDLSKCVKGVGIKYGQQIFNIGTITPYDFQSNTKFTLGIKTHSSTLDFVLDLDKFTTTDIFKELLVSLLHHVGSVVSMYELRTERNESARYDPLTELLTRQEFSNLVFREIEILKRENEQSAFVLVDIKDFKEFNDRYGHFEGDVLMKYIAKVIKNSTRITDISCRWGEDSFAIYFANFKKTDMKTKESEIIGKIKEFKRSVNVKIGVSYYPQDGETFEELMKMAEERSNTQSE
ncbi:GGDEF domain-containing protein [Athalassotoga saccharophila]|uniref:GGDEF domain-containing protein n=1 Tax=Athalassotoga saccharophila TaxID=1441386 RepID=UPI00137AA700|nr:GGDEF domain-containing protein [Athalassotoga saccharophila]BBJ28305.1 putative signaling protein [Athalassotoga saccharophila]